MESINLRRLLLDHADVQILSAGTQWHEPYRMIRDTVQRRGGFACILFGLADDEVPSSLKQYMVEQLVWLELIGMS